MGDVEMRDDDAASVIDDENCILCRASGAWIPRANVECVAQEDLPLPGDWAYDYVSRAYSSGAKDTFDPHPKSWVEVVKVALYNLWREQEDATTDSSDPNYFHFKKHICQFIDANWNRLCHGKTRTQTWHNTISSALSSHPDEFISGSDVLGQQGYWSLRIPGNPMVGRAGSKSSSKRKRGGGGRPKKRRSKLGNKRRSIQSDDGVGAVVDEYHPAVEKPRYSPLAKYTEVVFAKENSAPQVDLEGEDMLTVCNPKGFRTARASHGASHGAWYFELEVLPSESNSHTRLGWSTNRGEVQAPVGFDYYSYSYRDIEGDFFHQSRTRKRGEPYTVGDIIGCYIYLPAPDAKGDAPSSNGAEASPRGTASSSTGGPRGPGDEKPPVASGGKILFAKNGALQPLAFTDIFRGTYYPAASMYMAGRVRANFGPTFRYPPEEMDLSPPPKPCCLLAPPTPSPRENPSKGEEDGQQRAADDPKQHDAPTSSSLPTASDGADGKGMDEAITTTTTESVSIAATPADAKDESSKPPQSQDVVMHEEEGAAKSDIVDAVNVAATSTSTPSTPVGATSSTENNPHVAQDAIMLAE